MRTDPHTPSAFIPADYEYRFSYALPQQVAEDWIPSFNLDLIDHLSAEPWATTGETGKCSVCGAAFIYGDVWQHQPTGEYLHLGHVCANKYAGMTDRSAFLAGLKAHRESHATAIARERLTTASAAFLDAHPGLAAALATDHYIVRDIAYKLKKYGSLSEAQVALVEKLAAERAAAVIVPAVPALEGKQTVTGRVGTTKWQENDFGGGMKMLIIVNERGGEWKAWGTVPASLMNAWSHEATIERGDTVTFTATFCPKHDDGTFAFFKRPTKATMKARPVEAADDDETSNEPFEMAVASL